MLVVALSLAAPAAAIDVPFLPQTDALCGGAATAMVFRYWGDAHADVQEFAPLVDRRAGGIVNDALVDAVRRRGWRAGRDLLSPLDVGRRQCTKCPRNLWKRQLRQVLRLERRDPLRECIRHAEDPTPSSTTV